MVERTTLTMSKYSTEIHKPSFLRVLDLTIRQEMILSVDHQEGILQKWM